MKKHNPIIFVESCDPYRTEVLIASGATQKDVVSYAKKNKLSKVFRKWVESDKYMFCEIEKKLGLFCWREDGNDYQLLILLRQVKDIWEYWETVAHELHHLVYHISKKKQLDDEMEAQAYLFEHLFRNIRRKLMGIDKLL